VRQCSSGTMCSSVLPHWWQNSIKQDRLRECRRFAAEVWPEARVEDAPLVGDGQSLGNRTEQTGDGCRVKRSAGES
jgi:hypothetical protein